MNTTVTLYKHPGKTPLQALERFRAKHPELQLEKMAYAGRLDPMAEGKLLVLVGDACKERDKYLDLDKEYIFEVLLGFESDTHDVLGLVKASQNSITSQEIESQVSTVLSEYQGKVSLPYPVFSSKTVAGKPLFLWALENRIDEIDIPVRESTIHEMSLEGIDYMSMEAVVAQAREKISQVDPVAEQSKSLGNDFRRLDVLDSWKVAKEAYTTYLPDHRVAVLTIKCICSSGTYMRTLADIIGEHLGVGGLAWSIKRTSIGVYNQESKTWDKLY